MDIATHGGVKQSNKCTFPIFAVFQCCFWKNRRTSRTKFCSNCIIRIVIVKCPWSKSWKHIRGSQKENPHYIIKVFKFSNGWNIQILPCRNLHICLFYEIKNQFWRFLIFFFAWNKHRHFFIHGRKTSIEFTTHTPDSIGTQRDWFTTNQLFKLLKKTTVDFFQIIINLFIRIPKSKG